MDFTYCFISSVELRSLPWTQSFSTDVQLTFTLQTVNSVVNLNPLNINVRPKTFNKNWLHHLLFHRSRFCIEQSAVKYCIFFMHDNQPTYGSREGKYFSHQTYRSQQQTRLLLIFHENSQICCAFRLTQFQQPQKAPKLTQLTESHANLGESNFHNLPSFVPTWMEGF